MPARCAGADEVGAAVSTVAIDALSTGTPVNLCACSGCASCVSREASATGHTGGVNKALGSSWTCHCSTRISCLFTEGSTEAGLALTGDAIHCEDTDAACFAGVGR